ncbi:MAG: 4Fe-4S binding protein [Clostridiales bacterium]|nr:4Fe-4S binding protein [Clostridiales bacterium]
MKKITIYRERCKACGYCINFCPREALSFSEEINSKGYKPVQVDEERCIACGICYSMCPDYVFEITKE